MKFEAHVQWQPQNLPFTAKEYSRQYLVRSPGKPDFIGTAAPDFSGSPYHPNPEDLLVMSLSACHMLSYLAYCAGSKVIVLDYQDAAVGEVHKSGHKFCFKEVQLKPRVIVADGTDLEKAKMLHDKAHDACFIGNSVNFPVMVEPEILTASQAQLYK